MMIGSLHRTLCPLVLVVTAVLTPMASAADPHPGESNSLTCRAAWGAARLPEEGRLELITELAYHAIQSQRLGTPIGQVRSTILGLVSEDTCRPAPETPFSDALDPAVLVAADTALSTLNVAAF
jgi:hypothetical protein